METVSTEILSRRLGSKEETWLEGDMSIRGSLSQKRVITYLLKEKEPMEKERVVGMTDETWSWRRHQGVGFRIGLEEKRNIFLCNKTEGDNKEPHSLQHS